MSKRLYEVIKLREKTYLQQILGDKYGCYKWWAKKDELLFICKRLGVELNDIVDNIEKRDDLYCIYVGQSHRELRKRIVNHLNGPLKRSTFRRSIGALFGKTEIDNLLDKFYIEFDYVPANKDVTVLKKEIDDKEFKLINSHLRILNIQENDYQHEKINLIIGKLKDLRKGVLIQFDN